MSSDAVIGDGLPAGALFTVLMSLVLSFSPDESLLFFVRLHAVRRFHPVSCMPGVQDPALRLNCRIFRLLP